MGHSIHTSSWLSENTESTKLRKMLEGLVLSWLLDIDLRSHPEQYRLLLERSLPHCTTEELSSLVEILSESQESTDLTGVEDHETRDLQALYREKIMGRGGLLDTCLIEQWLSLDEVVVLIWVSRRTLERILDWSTKRPQINSLSRIIKFLRQHHKI